MNRRVFKRNPIVAIFLGLRPLVFTAAVIVALMFGLGQAQEASRAESVRVLEETITRVVVHSYAVNGRFPESLDYIVSNYDVFIDSSRFLVHYEVFAANILPDIRVFQLDR